MCIVSEEFFMKKSSIKLSQLKSHPYPYHEEGDQPKSSLIVSLSLLAVAFIVVIFSSKCLIGSIDGVVESSGLSRTFVGFVLLPILGNAAKIMIIVTTTINDRTGLSINIDDDENSVPHHICCTWMDNINEMTLHFQSLEAAVFFIAFLMANYLIQRYNLQKFKEKF
ncbi:hypothetical protein C1646_756050 [Rhizophagus diaphanus]|nr:hypothetical protein C1646_756050 [Rhizophagus diaphanus] [Rhizophagus sp. MUCL 43196]